MTIDTRTPDQPVNLIEYESHARAVLDSTAYAYVAGGSAQEITMRANRDRFDAIRLAPRVLRDVSRIDTTLELFGQKLEFPVLLAPTAFHKLLHAEGEIATARGAGAAEALLVVSSLATVAIENVARAAQGLLWFQLYMQRDRSTTEELVRRAEAAGCRALVVTVDTPVLGSRDRERRPGFAFPPELRPENLVAQMRTGNETWDRHDVYNQLIHPGLTWQDVTWLRSIARVPVLLKGILVADDAKLAVEHGADGIVVSNHGGRNLDTVPATIDALPGVIDAVQGRVPVLMDGGVRRGTDVIKALALGASAVLIGRPYLWGLAHDGAAGVQRVVELLRRELIESMALCGRPRLSDLDRSVLWDSDRVG